MTSTQLVAGSGFALPELKAHWLKFNNSSGYQYKISQNTAKPKARLFCVCFTAPESKKEWENSYCCKAHLHAVGDTRDDMSIISVDMNC